MIAPSALQAKMSAQPLLMKIPSLATEPAIPALPNLLGEFTVVARLGEGGSGVVYAVKRNGADLALKVLRPDLALSERETRAFFVEASQMCRVEHPSLIPVIDAGTLPDGRPYLAMPLLRGEALAARLTRGPLAPLHALAIFDGLAGAVAALHAAGLVHRDIKPENIFLLEGEERLVLLDLGIAREIDAPASTTTQAGMVRGTPAYMAPERFFGAPASVGTDLYELAVVLYVMLVGRLPWDSVHDAKGRMFPRRPEAAGVAISGSLAQALLDALSTNVDLRPASVPAFVERIRRAFDEPSAAFAPTLKAAASRPSTSPPEAARTVPPPAETLASPLQSGATSSPRARGDHVRRHLLVGVAVILALGAVAALFVRSKARSPHVEVVASSSVTIADAGVIEPPPSSASVAIPLESAPSAKPGQGSPHASAAPIRVTPHPVASASASPSPSAGPTDLPQCRKLLALYCSPAFKATDGGGQCRMWQPTFARYLALPPEGRAAVDDGCRMAFGAGVDVLAERQRQIDAGIHP
jgi:serine/threonine protein kinase